MLAARFGVGETTVLRWVSRGLLGPEAGGGKGHSFRFRLDPKTEATLQEAAEKVRAPNAGFYTSGMIAARFGVNEATVHRWVEKGILRAASGGGKGHPFRFRLDAGTEAALIAAAKKAHAPRRS